MWLTHYKIAIIANLTYRVGILIWVAARFVEPTIYMAVWSTVAQGGRIGNFSVGEFTAYFIAITLVNQLTFAKVMLKYEQRIRRGTLSMFLLRPASVVIWDAVENLAMRSIVLPPTLVGVAILALVFQPTFHTPSWAIVLFPVAFTLAWITNFVIDYVFGMSAFWLTSISAVDRVLYLGLCFFSGRLAPLELLPPAFQTLAAVLPFRWILAFPAELLIGKLTIEQAVTGFVMQMVWILIGFIALHGLWRAGIRRYTGVDG